MIQKRFNEFKSTPFGDLMIKMLEGQYGDDDASKNKQSVAQSASIRGITLPSPPPVTSTKICSMRRKILHDTIIDNIGIDYGEAGLTALCTQLIDNTGPNLSCPFNYVLGDDGGFSKGNLDFYINHPMEVPPGYTYYPEIFYATELFCECYHAHEMGCATKIPRQGDDLAALGNSGAAAKWLNYCKAAGIWNADFDKNDVVLSSEVKECGCYFIGQARELVDECPGVDLGYTQR
jgi:hypothetical protein